MSGFLKRLGANLLRGLLMIWIVSTFTFFLVRLMPGNPVQAAYETLLEQGKSPQEAQTITQFRGWTPLIAMQIEY